MDAFELSAYHLNFSMLKILPGVDNVRHYVYLSPAFCLLSSKIIPQLIARHIHLDQFFKLEKPDVWAKKLTEFKRLYRLMIEDAVNKSKLENNPEIDYLAQIAIIKYLIANIRSQFENFANQIKNIIRKYQSTRSQEISDSAKTKETLSSVLQNSDAVLRDVGNELFQILADVSQNELRTIREANFGAHKLLPDDILENPVFHTKDPFHDSFLIDAYDVIFGRRLEDPDRYDNLVALLTSLFRKLNRQVPEINPIEGDSDKSPTDEGIDSPPEEFDPGHFIKKIDNINRLLNWDQTKEDLKRLKKQKVPKQELLAQKQ